MICLGIDLGTTYSAVATMDPSGRPRVLPNSLGELTTPSVVSFLGPGEAIVGGVAKDRRPEDPDHTVALFKRRMGTDFPLEFHGVTHTPESVSAVLLRALVADARAALGVAPDTPVSAVVTVPAYFGVPEKEATQQAAEMAGIEVLELVAEPVAAALHYGVADTSDRTALVYDLGGGTFDCTVLRTAAGTVTAVATDGDPNLGGAEVDERLGAVLLDRLVAALPAGTDADDALDDAALREEVLTLAEIAKRNLAGKQRHRVTLRHGGHTVRTELDRDLLTGEAQDMVDRTMVIVERLLATAGDVALDEIVLVGGSSRLPAVAEALRERFGRAPLLADPELAVALGAAVRADRLAGRAATGIRAAGAAPDTQAVSVLPRGVGILVRDSYDPEGRREFVQHLIPANTALPARETAPFSTIVDRQSSVRIQVYEQAGAVASAEPGHNRRVLDGEFTGLGELPAGSRVDVTIEVGLDGRLSVTARDVLLRTDLSLQAYVEGVVDDADVARLSAATRALVIRQ